MTTRSTTPATQKHLQIARLPLGLHLPLHKIDRLRKTVSAIAGQDDNLLHNHASREKVIYRYPLVQYKSVLGEASILGIGEEGCRSLENLLEKEDFTAIFNENGLTRLEKECLQLQLTDRPTRAYRLLNWLPFNDGNYQKYHQTQSLLARTALLENCLIGHILKFCSAIGWLLPPRSLYVELTDLRPVFSKQVHGNNFRQAYDALFLANIELPEHIGLGKAVSHSFGVCLKQ